MSVREWRWPVLLVGRFVIQDADNESYEDKMHGRDYN